MIIHVEQFGRGNTCEYVSKITKELKEETKLFIATSSHTEYTSDYELLNFYKNYNLHNQKFLKLLSYILGWFSVYRFVKKSAKKETVIIHLHWLRFSVFDFYLLQTLKRKCKIVLTMHESLPHQTLSFDRKFFEKIYANCIDGFIFHSETSKKSFEKKFKIQLNVDDFTIIPHYGYKPGGTSIQRKPGEILFFGSIKEYKGLDVLIDSLDFLNPDLDFVLNVVGKPYYDLSKIESRCKNNSHVHLKLGWVSEDDLDRYLKQASLVVFPYHLIDTSGAIHLAMSYGKVIIATKVGMFPELLGNNEFGLLIEKGKPEKLGELISQVLGSFEKYEELGNRAYVKMIEEHSLKKIGVKLKSYYQLISND